MDSVLANVLQLLNKSLHSDDTIDIFHQCFHVKCALSNFFVLKCNTDKPLRNSLSFLANLSLFSCQQMACSGGKNTYLVNLYFPLSQQNTLLLLFLEN